MSIKYNPSNINLPNISVDEVLDDDVVIGYRLTANEGYVIYDTSDETTEPAIDPETEEPVVDPETGLFVEVPVTYYSKEAVIPARIPVENWTWVAVAEERAV